MKSIVVCLSGAVLVAAIVGLALQLLDMSNGEIPQTGPDVLVEPPFLIIDATDRQQVATVGIKNASRTALRLLKISSSCGCTVVDPPERDRLEPGQTVKLQIRGTPPTAGQKSSFVQIETDSASTRWVRVNLLLKGKKSPVPRIVRLPDRVTLQSHRQRPEKISSSFQVSTIEEAGSEYWLKTPTDFSDRLTIEAQPPVEFPGDDPHEVSRLYKFTALGTVDPQDPWEDTIVLKTSAQRVPIPVVAEYQPRIKIVPSTLFFDLTSGETSLATRTIVLLQLEGASVPEITVEPPMQDWIQVQRIEPPSLDPRVLARIAISLSPTLRVDKGTSRSVVHIKTSDPDCPSVELPIVIKNSL